MMPVFSGYWPEPRPEHRPGTRRWWLGSAVDKEGSAANLENLRDAGFGAVEITPVHGVKGADN